MASDFCHLHVHTDLSALDGLAKPGDYVERAKQLGQPALAITDHGNLCGAPEFYAAARAAEIEPVLGCEFYFVPDSEAYRASKGKKGEDDGSRFHVTVLAKGAKGYSALSELSTESYKDFYFKPLLTYKLLQEFKEAGQMEHLVVLSGCANSILSKITLEDYDRARSEIEFWQGLPNFYVELMHHGTEFDWALNNGLMKLAREFNLPYVITNDPHYVDAEDCDHHDALLAVATGKDIDSPERLRFDGDGYHLRSAKEMRSAWKDYRPEVVKRGMAATAELAFSCRTRIKHWEKRSFHIPKYPDVKDSALYMKKLAKAGLKERFPEGPPPEYRERMLYELDVLNKAGLADFLLITRDIIMYAKQRGLPVGPGRGSVCGSLVGYLIGLHKIDPIRYDLMFERFFNPERPSMPDIDTDFGGDRTILFNYVTQKYGEENVVRVCAFQRKKLKGMLHLLGKSHGVSYQVTQSISKKLPDEIPGSWREDDEHQDQLEQIISENPILAQSPEFVAQLRKLNGVRSGVSRHSAGVVIAPPEHRILQQVPQMYIPSSKNWVAQYDLETFERLGYLKEDLLGLNTLDLVADCVKLVRSHTGQQLEPDAWVPDEMPRDDEAYAMLAKGDTVGVFQMKGNTNTRGMKEIGCTCFEDIVSCTSLYRTGPIAAGFPKQFVKNREQGLASIKYGDERLRPILEKTWGVILYQEQVMQIAKDLAGFDMYQVEDIKEAIKHKKSALMEQLEPKFKDGCAANGVKQAVTDRVWKQIEGYSGYSYNRSHAVAYSMTTYQTARLKLLYPLEFFSALLRVTGDKEERYSALRSITLAGFKVLPPCVNRSDQGATPDYDLNGVRLGMKDISGIGEKKAVKLVNRRPRGGYATPGDVADVVDQGAYTALAEAGALKCLQVPFDVDAQADRTGWTFTDKLAKLRARWAPHIVEPEEDGDTCRVAGQLVAKVNKQTTKGKPYQIWTIRWDNAREYKAMLWSGAEPYYHVPVNSLVMVEGEWQAAPWDNISINSTYSPVWVWMGKPPKWRKANKVTFDA